MVFDLNNRVFCFQFFSRVKACYSNNIVYTQSAAS
ncbi:unnamed protein product [Callosobruchus maculatus]|uniref:Uncharacterized protein n=1 Tax=Callosobruchus maculatus TaxID=64391 RepID=A0A653CVS1_CALMS|nr:unnamed protein product [Callosobruchus maculatus]